MNFFYSTPDIDISQLDSIKSDSILFAKYARSLKDDRSKYLIEIFTSTRKLRYGHGGVLPAEYTHQYNKVNEDHNRKLILIGIGNDSVIVVLKKVQMFTAVYTRMEGLPISISNNRENETNVLSKLLSTGMIHKVAGIPIEMKEVEELGLQFSESVDSYNFYTDLKKSFDKMSVRKWGHKNGLWKCEAMENLHFEILSSQSDLPRIKQIQKGFTKYKEDRSIGAKTKLAKSIETYEFWKDESVIYYLTSYKDIPTGFIVFLITDDNTAHQIVSKSIGRADYGDDILGLTPDENIEFQWLKRPISRYIHYKTIEDLISRGITIGYFGGTFNMPSLRTYKQMLYDEEVKHNIYKL